MTKKGFTLIELIAVISLLAVIALIALPAVDSALKEGRERLSKTQEKQIIKGAKEFFADNTYCLPGSNADKCDIDKTKCAKFSQDEEITKLPIYCIQNAGYLPSNITDFNKNEDGDDNNYSATAYVKVTKESDTETETDTNNYNYNYEVVTPNE